jgi:hypothetical protein
MNLFAWTVGQCDGHPLQGQRYKTNHCCYSELSGQPWLWEYGETVALLSVDLYIPQVPKQ